MASEATQNAILTCSYMESLALSLRHYYDRLGKHSARLDDLTGKLQRASNVLIQCYPQLYRPEEVSLLEAKIKSSQEFIAAVGGNTIVIGTSVILALVTDLEEINRNPSRRQPLEFAVNILGRIHNYFDRRGDRRDDYEKAERVLAHYRRLKEARGRWDGRKMVLYWEDDVRSMPWEKAV